MRYLANGQLDTGFGAGGRAVIDVPGARRSDRHDPAARRRRRAAWPAGGGDRFVARLTPAGALDPTFGTAGTGFVAIDSGTAARRLGLAVGAGGQLYLAGHDADNSFTSASSRSRG